MELYFTRDAFATTSSEVFEVGFVPRKLVVSGDKKAIFVVGDDKTIYRY